MWRLLRFGRAVPIFSHDFRLLKPEILFESQKNRVRAGVPGRSAGGTATSWSACRAGVRPCRYRRGARQAPAAEPAEGQPGSQGGGCPATTARGSWVRRQPPSGPPAHHELASGSCGAAGGSRAWCCCCLCCLRLQQLARVPALAGGDGKIDCERSFDAIFLRICSAF